MMEAQKLFANSRVNITAEGKRHLGAVIWNTEYRGEYVKNLVKDWNNQPILSTIAETHTAQKMKFSIKDFFSKCEQIRRKLRICSHLLKKSLIENVIFCAVTIANSLFSICQWV